MACTNCGSEENVQESVVNLIDDDNKPVSTALCRTCRRMVGDKRMYWCPHEDHRGYYEVDDPDWGPHFSSVGACPEHSLETNRSVTECQACGAGVRDDVCVNARGHHYCLGCWDVSHNCGSAGCTNRHVLAHRESYITHPSGLKTCRQCPPVATVRWFSRAWGRLSEWEYKADCGCRACEHLGREYPDLYPGLQMDPPGGRRKRCRNCDWASYDGRSFGGNNRWYCHMCITTMFAQCRGCEERFPGDEIFPLGARGEPICRTCVERGGQYWYCNVGCARWYRRGADCQCGGVHRWDYVPDTFRFFTASDESFRSEYHPYVAFELEVEAQEKDSSRVKGAGLVKEILGTDWSYLVHDGSLLDRGQRGFEIVSHPFTLNFFNSQWSTIEKLLLTLSTQGYRSWEGGRCGMHVHISRAPMTDAHQMKFLRFIYGSSNLAICIGQRGYRSRGITQYAPFDHERRDQFLSKIRNHTNPGAHGHHAAVNTTKAATLEGRWFRGTLNPAGFRKNIEFMHSVWYFTQKFGFASANEMNYLEWLRSPPESRTYAVLLDYIERNYITRR